MLNNETINDVRKVLRYLLSVEEGVDVITKTEANLRFSDKKGFELTLDIDVNGELDERGALRKSLKEIGDKLPRGIVEWRLVKTMAPAQIIQDKRLISRLESAWKKLNSSITVEIVDHPDWMISNGVVKCGYHENGAIRGCAKSDGNWASVNVDTGEFTISKLYSGSFLSPQKLTVEYGGYCKGRKHE